jgi:gamma-glutamylcyclotransferase (GGCT)/AIG2-like uncharacterized protein YtfP
MIIFCRSGYSCIKKTIEMPQLFVYGTLKSSFSNHDEMLKGEKYLGAYVTFNKYPLVITVPWNSPVMFPEPGVGNYVY